MVIAICIDITVNVCAMATESTKNIFQVTDEVKAQQQEAIRIGG